MFIDCPGNVWFPHSSIADSTHANARGSGAGVFSDISDIGVDPAMVATTTHRRAKKEVAYNGEAECSDDSDGSFSLERMLNYSCALPSISPSEHGDTQTQENFPNFKAVTASVILLFCV
mmetsp:Transcript_37816/g.56592  ORF Transcript_37816/g.56592 Transcript_37816/m.56592 type:complete len:119 (-) Transcript_37816:76-432(-)